MNEPDTCAMPRQCLSVELLGSIWQLERHGDLESLWEAMGNDDDARQRFARDERLPYWTELWPSSMLLGKWLGRCAAQLEGRRCLDLGCGLGLSALAGASLGAQVLAVDYEWPAVAFARDNVRRNADKLAAAVLPAQMDWRAPALRKGAFTRIWGADVMYERRFAEPLAEVLEYSLAPGGLVWIAEPGREVFGGFVELVRSKGWSCEPVLREKTPQVTVPGPPASVTIWELSCAL